MDTQNNNDNIDSSANSDQTIENNTSTTNQEMQFQPPIAPQHKNRKWFYIVISILIVAGFAAGAWAYTNSNDEATIPATSSTTETAQTANDSFKPTSVVYSYSTGISDPAQLYTRPLSGGDRVSVKIIKAKDFVAQSDVHKNKVLVVTQGGFGSSLEAAILYSEDSGKTYEKIFSEIPANASESSMGAQITSASFSTDGSAIVFAILADDRAKNIVKEISLQTKIEKDLFSSEQAGVFIEAYDRDDKQIYYYKGCYNCDGNAYNKLYSQDLGNNTESVIYDTTSKYGVQTVLNEDRTKAIVVSGVSGESLGASAPYTIEELDFATKKFKNIATINEEIAPRVGYSETGTPYYSDGSKIYSVDKNEPSLIFEDDQPIRDVYLVSKERVVASSGLNDFKLTNYDLTTKKATIVLNGDQNTRIFGVVWQ